MIDVACVGILVADIIISTVNEIPAKGLLYPVDSIEMYTGGNAMTAALNIKKMGLKTAIIGKVGNDMFGRFLKEKLDEKGVDTKGLSIDKDVCTSSSAVMVAKDGERSFLHCVGANGKFSIKDVNWAIIEDAKIVFVTGTYLMDTFDGAQTAEFLKTCKEKGKITVLDVCYDSSGRWAQLLDEAMPYIDIFLPSIDEAKNIAGKDNLQEMSEEFFKKGVKSVVIKCGSDGCYAAESEASGGMMVATYKAEKVVDTTGAGDSFCSGFLAAYARGKSFKECVEFANAAGTFNVMAKGATTGIKTFEETEKFIKINKGE
ncbi:MAG: carbohydrate kinase family protein [Bacillota bacterium]|nr:carbohydrate kinase family protein [Bacillota bacterium]